MVALDFAVLDVTDDEFVVANFGENLAAADETFPGLGIPAQLGVQSAHGDGVFVGIGRQPNIGHATAVDDFLQVVIPKMSGLPRLGIFTTKNIQ